MDKFEFGSFANLDERLKSAAEASRPDFSPELHERILAAIDDCETLPLHSWSTHWRRPLALAASLLVIATGAALAGYSLIGSSQNAPHSTLGSDPASFSATTLPSDALASNDSELMQRALAAADHWGWLDEDSRSDAAWFVADMPLDADSPDAATIEEDDDASLGS